MGLIHCNLRVLMAERGLNIQKVKDNTTLSRTTISNLYNNNGNGVQFDTLKQLCELLKCKPGDLITYIDIEPEFEIITEVPDVTMESDTHVLNEEGDGYDYVSSIKTNLVIHCKLRYEGDIHEFNFQVEVTYTIDENKLIDNLSIGTSVNLEFKLDQLQTPPHAQSFFYSEFELSLIAWAIEYFSEEVEDVASYSANYYDLLR